MKRLIKDTRDEMTPKERMTAMINGDDYDRIPCVPFLGEYNSKLLGVSISEYFHSASLMVKGEIKSFKRFGHDSLSLGPCAYGIAEAIGANVIFPNNGYQYAGNPVITDYSIFSSTRMINPQKDGRISLYMNACENLLEVAGDVIGIGCSVGGPFTIAGHLRGPENILRDTKKKPEELHNLMRLVTDNIKICVKEISSYNVGITMSDPLASGSVISSNIYKEFVMPYTAEIIDYIYKMTGEKASLHM